MMERSIKVTRMITKALEPLQQMCNELKRKKQQIPITMFFQKVTKRTTSTIDEPQPSTSSAPDIMQPLTSSAAFSTSSLPRIPEADDR